MIQIIEAGVDDFDTIHALAWQVWPQTYGAILSAPQIDYMFSMMYSRDAYIEQLTIKNHHFLLVKQDDLFLGFASYQPGYETGITKIHKLYILPGL
ncbi:hypothetical protein [Flavobacterium cyanobacteriorum]|uniref:hypothetical protein n=1 Tax=Flavobacterium cyanobacteriorum TaxID=2022802 RepID=UPI001A9C4066|nr:hypothetical protein [Flavobacterium cyanobacteriorum]